MIVEDSETNSSRCRCPGCPTHDGCMSENDERLYCSRDRTECDVTAHGCPCNECPVWSENRLGGRYFCIEGTARQVERGGRPMIKAWHEEYRSNARLHARRREM